MDLADLSSVKSGVETFLTQNGRLDVFVNNVGVRIIQELRLTLVMFVHSFNSIVRADHVERQQ